MELGKLLFDMDNDGQRDIFVSNGIYKDLLDRDYLAYTANEQTIRNRLKNNEDKVITSLIDAMPSQAVPNAAFKNKGALSFESKAAEWGLGTPSFSNGSAYGDLDNDGDLDLVVNNVNMPSFLYQNKTDTLHHRSLTFRFLDTANISPNYGTKVTAFKSGDIIGHGEYFVSRGFQSTVPHELHLGVGRHKTVDSVSVIWPNGKKSVKRDLGTNQRIMLVPPKSTPAHQITSNPSLPLKTVARIPKFKHMENAYIDFDNERLLGEMKSNEGPALAISDVNGDGKDDIFLGGAKHQNNVLYLSKTNGYDKITAPFDAEKDSEATAAIFFDADQDGDADLYVCHGGRAFSQFSIALNDVYYENIGQGNFRKKTDVLPRMAPKSTNSVAACDYDRDGDLDLAVGERYKTSVYGLPGSIFLLKNNGDGTFSNVAMPKLQDIGMTTNIAWADFNADGWDDLVSVGEWMGIRIFLNDKGNFREATEQMGLGNTKGLWSALEIMDIDQDGDLDLLTGNIGENTFYTTGTTLYIHDFDQNGFREQLFCEHLNGQDYPLADKDELVSQLPSLRKKLTYYEDYGKATMQTLFDASLLEASQHLKLDMVKSMVFLNQGETFEPLPLPPQAQYAPIYDFTVADVDADGHRDILFGGNQFMVKPQFGRYDASKGWIIFGPFKKDTGYDKALSLGIEGQIRRMEWATIQGKKTLVVARNNDDVLFYEKP